MKATSSGRRAGWAALAIAMLPGYVLTGPPTAASAASPEASATIASVTSSTSLGIRFVGSDGPDTVVLSRAGSPAAPLVVLDTAGPIAIGAGCRPAVGDPTAAVCAAPYEAGTVLRRVQLHSGAGVDVLAHGASLPIPLDVQTGPGRDSVNGGPGQDLISGGYEDDLLRGGGGTDQLAGASGNDRLEGGPGYGDGLNGGSGDDHLFGGEGDHDNLDGGVGADEIDGGPGDNDTVSYEHRTAGVGVELGPDSTDNGEFGEGDQIVGIEHVRGGAGDDKLIGDDGQNTLIGGPGHDWIEGRLSEDLVWGGDGNDRLTGNLIDGPVNADGIRDFLEGNAGTDVCHRSPADDDALDTCETVINDD